MLINLNVKVVVNLKGSGCNIWEVLEVLHGARRESFRQNVFGYLLDVPRLQRDVLIFHKMFLHQLRLDVVVSLDGIKRLYLRLGDTKMVYGPEEFCFIIGFAWNSYLWEVTCDDLEDTCNKIDRYFSLSERRQTFKYSVSGFTAPFMLFVLVDSRYEKTETPRIKRLSGTKNLKWVDVNKILDMTKEGRRPRHSMSPSDDEMTSSYYMSCQEYVYGERNSVSSLVQDHFRRQDESSSSMSSSGRSHCRVGRNGKPNLEEVLKWLHALKQQVFMNREPTKIFIEEVDNESIWNNFIFEEPAEFQTNFGENVLDDEAVNKNNANEMVLGDIEDEKDLDERIHTAGGVLEEDVIITGTVNHFDDHVFDGNEVTLDRPRLRNPSKYRCTPYTEFHTTPKQKQRQKKTIKTTEK
uniref:Uncharacterized protein n=1 Tax=Lactuca sativa TaxID=4236 RepID=A0A9R1XR06_LACSA|nr:hypothetical protein LSAT_V11C200092620 [Lactuca sativa]